MVDRAFLKVFDTVQSTTGLGGTAARLYTEIVRHGRTDPITEADLEPPDRELFATLVTKHSQENDTTKGHVDYKDYAGTKHGPTADSNLLGGFDYEIEKDGTILITDSYDFNKVVGGSEYDDNALLKVLGTFIMPYGVASHIGRKAIHEAEGKSIPVRIRLNPSVLDPSVVDDVERASATEERESQRTQTP